MKNLYKLPLMLITLAATTLDNTYAALPDKSLVYCSEVNPIGFDLSGASTISDFTASAETLYNRLVEFSRDGTKIEPGLAKRWDISSDGLVYTFYLRRGVKFHTTPWFTPTREFNADDVLFTFERMRNPKIPFRKAYPTEFPNWHHTGLDQIVWKIEVPDPYTVRFILNTPHAPFLSNLAAPFASVLSGEYAAQLLKAGKAPEIKWKPVGTGPFILRTYHPDEKIFFDGNPEYWKPADVQLSHLIFAITPDAAVRTQKLKRGECQAISAPRPADIAMLKADPHLQVLSRPGFNMGYLAYNVTHKPLDNVWVRRALNMAIDKQAIIDRVFEGQAQQAVAPMAPMQWSYDKTLQDAPRDLKQAKAFLAQAGYPEGFSISLWAMPVQRSYNPNGRLMAEMIQADWAKIGVKANIVMVEWGEYLKRTQNGEHDTVFIGITSTNSDPDNWLMLLSCGAARSGYNVSKWCYKPFDDLIQQAVQTTDSNKRTQLYIQAQQIFKREQPFTPIAYATIYQPLNKNVTGFTIDSLGTTSFAGVGLR